ncbi:helix-turn-helix domain-containing protein [Nonomuraea longicatena]
MEDAYRISDPEVLRIVAHPLRVRLLGLLRAEGPATASQLGRKVDESSGSTSYHLRELAKHGFIEEDPSPDGRERRWRAKHLYTSWDNVQLSATPEGREVRAVMRDRQVEALARSAQGYDPQQWGESWDAVAGMSDFLFTLTPAALGEFFERTQALMEELAERCADDPEAAPVNLFYAGWPRER